jgi:hypothetical protein
MKDGTPSPYSDMPALSREHSLSQFGLFASWSVALSELACRGTDHLVPCINACISSRVSLPSLLLSIALKILS